MQKRKLRDLEVSAIGYGCMGLSMGYGEAPGKDESLRLIRAACDMGCTLFNTAEFYGVDGVNEELLGEALKGVRNDVVISTKFWIPGKWEGTSKQLMQELRTRLENSLKRLNTDHIELYTQARVNDSIPLEDVAYCMAEFIKEGKIGGWGLSQANADQVLQAHLVTPLTAIESEYSMMERTFEKGVLPLCKDQNIGFMAFSPLANGFLSGKVDPQTEYTGIDARRVISRFYKENQIANQPLLSLLRQFAEAKNATPAQISLAWMLHKYDFLVPIPGSRKLDRISENLHATDVVLSDDEFSKIETELASIEIHGNRTDEDIAKLRAIIARESASSDTSGPFSRDWQA
ncbi:aldo/keto reductase [Fulvivirga ulvae]|uniref:aldo/keto reductase n=1 Tax=Fulvivirga ulvae TaxID=2904245 RepID=UPI001F18186B|nr:aldo/keto reductase [Fulvivirga ulvae]UII34641.1 aldo/keto reductase [Fulvivirga ulvae]